MRGLEYSITRAAAEMAQCSQALTQLHPPPPPYSLCIILFLSVSLFHFCVVFSHSLARTSLFLGLSPLCLTILLFLWFSQSLQSSISVLLHFPSNSSSILPLCYSQTYPSMHPPMLICWPWFCLHNLRHQTQFPVFSLTTLLFFKDNSSLS